MTQRTPYDGGIFPDPRQIVTDELGFVGVGADLRPETLIEAYSKGYFPWEGRPPYPWYSPDPRLILDPGAFVASRSLRKFARRSGYHVSFDRDFQDVMRRCASTPRRGQSGTWITRAMVRAYSALHERGIAHCVEIRDDTDRLVGGLYGLTIGRAFFGESMFSAVPNASKLALWALTQNLTDRSFDFVDCQQDTAHLRSLGAHIVSRSDYLDRLEAAVMAASHHFPWSDWTVDFERR